MRRNGDRIVDETLARLPVTRAAERRVRYIINMRMAIRGGQVTVRGNRCAALALAQDTTRTCGVRGLLRNLFGLASLPEKRLAELGAASDLSRRRRARGT